jgi:hypothetical protein
MTRRELLFLIVGYAVGEEEGRLARVLRSPDCSESRGPYDHREGAYVLRIEMEPPDWPPGAHFPVDDVRVSSWASKPSAGRRFRRARA